jgi:hypothetical protein
MINTNGNLDSSMGNRVKPKGKSLKKNKDGEKFKIAMRAFGKAGLTFSSEKFSFDNVKNNLLFPATEVSAGLSYAGLGVYASKVAGECEDYVSIPVTDNAGREGIYDPVADCYSIMSLSKFNASGTLAYTSKTYGLRLILEDWFTKFKGWSVDVNKTNSKLEVESEAKYCCTFGGGDNCRNHPPVDVGDMFYKKEVESINVEVEKRFDNGFALNFGAGRRDQVVNYDYNVVLDAYGYDIQGSGSKNIKETTTPITLGLSYTTPTPLGAYAYLKGSYDFKNSPEVRFGFGLNLDAKYSYRPKAFDAPFEDGGSYYTESGIQSIQDNGKISHVAITPSLGLATTVKKGPIFANFKSDFLGYIPRMGGVMKDKPTAAEVLGKGNSFKEKSHFFKPANAELEAGYELNLVSNKGKGYKGVAKENEVLNLNFVGNARTFTGMSLDDRTLLSKKQDKVINTPLNPDGSGIASDNNELSSLRFGNQIGGRIELGYIPTEDWSIDLSGGYRHTTIKKVKDGEVDVHSYNEVPVAIAVAKEFTTRNYSFKPYVKVEADVKGINLQNALDKSSVQFGVSWNPIAHRDWDPVGNSYKFRN